MKDTQKTSQHEYWQVQCPSCMSIGYYFTEAVPEHLKAYRRWEIIRCRCGWYFTFDTALYARFLLCLKVPEDEVTPLMKRQASYVEQEVINPQRKEKLA